MYCPQKQLNKCIAHKRTKILLTKATTKKVFIKETTIKASLMKTKGYKDIADEESR